LSCAVALRNVTVSYRGHVALHDVSLDFHRGEFVGVIGPNGAGKTTLLTVINGLGRVHSGSVRILDEPATPASLPRLRRRIGYVPQQQRIDPRAPLSCRDAVAIGRYGRAGLLRRLGRKDHAAVDCALQLTGITALADRPVGQVSGGEAQKVAIARALAQEPEILLLDEPTASLDRSAVAEVTALVVAAWRDLKLTVVLVTHQLERLPEDCGTVVAVRAGRVLFCGPRAEALRPGLVERLYAGG
jgi:ABC-type Mn2+/Zn2+ transport system ATPase subunit